MIIGCFALVEPFSTLDRQFALIRELGIRHADLTDNHDGAGLGAEFGFAATASLDDHPGTVRRMVERHGITPTCSTPPVRRSTARPRSSRPYASPTTWAYARSSPPRVIPRRTGATA
jgi:hypothetical protein